MGGEGQNGYLQKYLESFETRLNNLVNSFDDFKVETRSQINSLTKETSAYNELLKQHIEGVERARKENENTRNQFERQLQDTRDKYKEELDEERSKRKNLEERVQKIEKPYQWLKTTAGVIASAGGLVAILYYGVGVLQTLGYL